MKNAIILGLSVALLFCSAIIHEANGAQYWSDLYLHNEIAIAYRGACEDSHVKSLKECNENALAYVKAFIERNNGN